MVWYCNGCKIIFEEKPTFTTLCPECSGGLSFEPSHQIGLYTVWGNDMIDNARCGFCGKKINKYYLKLKRPMRFSDTHLSNRVHVKCKDDKEFKSFGYELESDTKLINEFFVDGGSEVEDDGLSEMS